MSPEHEYSSDIAFTPAVKALQSRAGSRRAYANMEQSGSWETRVTAQLADFIREQTSFFMATVNAQGQPYIQHRGGPRGFLRVVDDHTLGFADYAGNRQYVSVGNLSENSKAHLFLIDYARRRRIKIWGTARVVDDDPELLARLMPQDYKARGERAFLFTVAAWDANCPQHIPQRFEAADVASAIAERDARIRELEAEVRRLREAGLSAGEPSQV